MEIRDPDTVVKVAAVTRSTMKKRRPTEVVQEGLVQRIRVDRILKAQEEERWIAMLDIHLVGDLANLTAEDTILGTVIGNEYEVDESGLLYFCPASMSKSQNREEIARLVVLEALQQEFLHHYHTILEGGHQGIGRTYQGSEQNFIGEVSIALYSDMWESVWIAKRAKGVL